jgi:DNA-binding CsgD family transcriptional regulator
MRYKGKFVFTILVLLTVAFNCNASQTAANEEIPLTIKVFNDKTKEFSISDISDEKFELSKGPVNRRFDDGNFWLDIEFDLDTKNAQSHYIFRIVHDFLESAELYAKDGDSFVFVGRAGYKVPREEMKIFDRIPAIPLEKTDDENLHQHFRMKILSHSMGTIQVRLVSEHKFFNSLKKEYFLIYIFTGISLCIFSVLLAWGITLKDPVHICLAFVSLFSVLFQLQLKGLSQILFKDFMSSYRFSGRLTYFFENCIILFLTMALYFILKKYREDYVKTRLIPLIFQLTAISFVLLAVLESATATFYSYSTLSIITKIVYVWSIVLIFRRVDAIAKTIMGFWVLANFLSTTSQFVRIIAISSRSFPVRIHFVDEFGFSFSIFLCITFPILYATILRFKRSSAEKSRRIAELENSVARLESQKECNTRIVKNLAAISGVTLGTADILSDFLFSQKNVESINLIKQNSSRIADTLFAVCACENPSMLSERPIKIADFFNNCILAVKHMNPQKEKFIHVSLFLKDDTAIYADTRILELVFLSVLNSVVEISLNEKRISVMLEGSGGDFILTVAVKLNEKDEKSAEKKLMECNEKRNLDFILQTAKIYGGEFFVSHIEGVFNFSLKLKFDRFEKIEAGKIFVNKILFSPSKNSENQNSVEQIAENSATSAEEKSDEQNTLIMMEMNDERKKFEIFSKREKDIVELIIAGKTDKEIASELFISVGTVASHNKKIFKKLEVHSRVELINKLR